jgi:hypothetical protein
VVTVGDYFLPLRLVLTRCSEPPRMTVTTITREFGADELLSVSPLEFQCEEHPGIVACGGMEVEASLGESFSEPTKFDLLNGFDADRERIIGDLYWHIGGSEVLGFSGVMDDFKHDMVHLKVLFTFSGGLNLYRDILTQNIVDDVTGEPWQGRPLGFILNDLCEAAGIPPHKRCITVPRLSAQQKFWSYAERPQRRWAGGISTDDNALSVTSLACGGSEVFIALDRHILAYRPSTKSWRFITSIQPQPSHGFCTVAILSMAYLSNPASLSLFCTNCAQPAFGGFTDYDDQVCWEVTITL